ncbi:hypothetical protein SCANM124S_00289 [Streptomyces canus]
MVPGAHESLLTKDTSAERQRLSSRDVALPPPAPLGPLGMGPSKGGGFGGCGLAALGPGGFDRAGLVGGVRVGERAPAG